MGGGGSGGAGSFGAKQNTVVPDMTAVALCCCPLLQALMFPKHLYEAIFEEELAPIKIFVRLYGATLLSKCALENPDPAC